MFNRRLLEQLSPTLRKFIRNKVDQAKRMANDQIKADPKDAAENTLKEIKEVLKEESKENKEKLKPIIKE